MTLELAGKTALVVGATSDMGMAIAGALAGVGATVTAWGRDTERLAALAAAGSHVRAVELADAVAIEAALASVGPVDVLIFNAAHPPERAPLLAGSTAIFRAVFEVNFFACERIVRGVLPGMTERGWGRLIAISSLAAAIGEAHGPAYCASKAALEGLFRSLAIDYTPAGVTANVVAPGPVATARLARWGAVKARRMALAAATRRLSTVEEVAHAVRFLASPAAGALTGETLRVDGGLHLGNPFAAMYVREKDPQP